VLWILHITFVSYQAFRQLTPERQFPIAYSCLHSGSNGEIITPFTLGYERNRVQLALRNDQQGHLRVEPLFPGTDLSVLIFACDSRSRSAVKISKNYGSHMSSSSASTISIIRTSRSPHSFTSRLLCRSESSRPFKMSGFHPNDWDSAAQRGSFHLLRTDFNNTSFKDLDTIVLHVSLAMASILVHLQDVPQKFHISIFATRMWCHSATSNSRMTTVQIMA
jgi:hypothetical protein